MLRILLICLLLSFSAPVLAIYKCESNGKTAYRQEPCSEGAGVDLSGKLQSNAAGSDATQARAQVAREKAEVARLEKARHKREAIEERASRASAAKQKKCQALAQRKKWLTEDAAESSAKSSAKARRKVRRLEEKIELGCGK